MQVADGSVSLAAYVEAFHTTALFKVDRALAGFHRLYSRLLPVRACRRLTHRVGVA